MALPPGASRGDRGRHPEGMPRSPQGPPRGRSVPHPSAPPPPVVRRPPLSPEQWAQAQAQRFIDAQVAAIEQQRKIYLDELKRQAEERVKQGLALAQALKAMGFDQRIQSLYGNAASDIAGYAQGFSGDIRNIANADAAQAANMLSGTGQEGAVRNEGENMGNVMYGAFGYNPAHAMRESGAAYASDAAMQPAFAARIAAYEANQMQQEGLKNLTDFAMQIAQAKGQLPQVKLDFLDRRTKLEQDAYARQRQALIDERNWWKDQQAILLAAGKYQLAQQAGQRAADAQRRLNNSSAGRDAWGNPKPGYSVGPNGQLIPPGYHWDPKKGRAVKDKSPKTGSGVWQGLREDMMNEKFTVTEMGPPTQVGNITVPGEKVTRKMTYAEARAKLIAEYKGRVKDTKRFLALVDEILAANGIEKPAPDRSSDPNGPENPGR